MTGCVTWWRLVTTSFAHGTGPPLVRCAATAPVLGTSMALSKDFFVIG